MNKITVTINGEKVAVNADSTAADAAKVLGFWNKSIVAELDGEILSKDEMDKHTLKDGSKLELIRFVGGG